MNVDVAIVGMAAVFPGAPDLATFAANIRNGVDAITEVPADRWDSEFFSPEGAKERPGDRLYTRRGGFVGAPPFDPLRFGIMPMAVGDIEAEQLIALATAANAIDDAGGPDRLGDLRQVGVILGRGGYFNAGMASLRRPGTNQQPAGDLAARTTAGSDRRSGRGGPGRGSPNASGRCARSPASI